MNKIEIQKKRRIRRKNSIRNKIFGTANTPRLSVFRSNKFIYVQAIDDENGNTIASSSSFKIDKNKKLNVKTAEIVGKDIGEKLKQLKISTIKFDRNGYLFAGKIKALADSARKTGLKF